MGLRCEVKTRARQGAPGGAEAAIGGIVTDVYSILLLAETQRTQAIARTGATGVDTSDDTPTFHYGIMPNADRSGRLLLVRAPSRGVFMGTTVREAHRQ